MKYCVYQYYRTPDSPAAAHLKVPFDYWNLSSKSFNQYSKKHGLDYKFLTHIHPVDPFYGIFLPFTEGWCEEYDAICFVDSDMLVTKQAPNIFDFASNNHISMYCMRSGAHQGHSRLKPLQAYGGHFNSGTVVFPRSLYNHLQQHLSKNLKHHHQLVTSGDPFVGGLGGYDQAYLNLYAVDNNLPVNKLTQEWNYHLSRLPNDRRFSAYFIHYHRHHKRQMQQDQNDERILL